MRTSTCRVAALILIVRWAHSQPAGCATIPAAGMAAPSAGYFQPPGGAWTPVSKGDLSPSAGTFCTKPPSLSETSPSAAALGADVEHSTRNCCQGMNITFGHFPFHNPPWWTYDAKTNTYGGMCTRVMNYLAREMGFKWHIINIDISRVSTSHWYDQLHEGKFQSMPSNPHALDNNTVPGEKVLMSYPFFWEPMRGVILRSTSTKTLFAWLQPFDTALWLATLGFIAGSAVLITVFNAADPAANDSTEEGVPITVCTKENLPRSIGLSLYHSWAMLLGGEEYEWISWPSRVFRIGMLLFICILVSTYTANLASFFTKQGVKYHGPLDMKSLKSARACFTSGERSPDGSSVNQKYFHFTGDERGFKSIHGSLLDSSAQERIVFCPQMLKEGKADIWLDWQCNQQSFIFQNNACNSLHMVPDIQLPPLFVNFAFANTAENRAFLPKLNAALYHMMASPQWTNWKNELWFEGDSCPKSEISDTDQVTLQGMGGLFIVYGCITAVAVIYALWENYRSSTDLDDHNDTDNIDQYATEGEMLKALLEQVKNLRHEVAAAKQPQPAEPIDTAGAFAPAALLGAAAAALHTGTPRGTSNGDSMTFCTGGNPAPTMPEGGDSKQHEGEHFPQRGGKHWLWGH